VAMEAFVQVRFFPFMSEMTALVDTGHPPGSPAVVAAACARAGVECTRIEHALATGRHIGALEVNEPFKRRHIPLLRPPALLFNGMAPDGRRRSASLDQLESAYDTAYSAARQKLDEGVPVEHV